MLRRPESLCCFADLWWRAWKAWKQPCPVSELWSYTLSSNCNYMHISTFKQSARECSVALHLQGHRLTAFTLPTLTNLCYPKLWISPGTHVVSQDNRVFLIFKFRTVWNNASSTAGHQSRSGLGFYSINLNACIACLGAFKRVCLNL